MGLSSFSEIKITVMRASTALFPHLGMGFVGGLRARVCLVTGSRNNERQVAHKGLTTVAGSRHRDPQYAVLQGRGRNDLFREIESVGT